MGEGLCKCTTCISGDEVHTSAWSVAMEAASRIGFCCGDGLLWV